MKYSGSNVVHFYFEYVTIFYADKIIQVRFQGGKHHDRCP
jgi:hypothetical protein